MKLTLARSRVFAGLAMGLLLALSIIRLWHARSDNFNPTSQPDAQAKNVDWASMASAPGFGNANSKSPSELEGSTIPDYPAAVKVTYSGEHAKPKVIELCQFCFLPPQPYCGVDALSRKSPCWEPRWEDSHPLPFEDYGHGEYVGPARTPHVIEYPLRVDDQIDFVYRFTQEPIPDAYRLEVGDEIIIESFALEGAEAIRRGDINLGRGLLVQPDGTVTLPQVGRVTVVGHTTEEVEIDLEKRYAKFLKDPVFTVTPLKTNAKLESLRSTVDARFGAGGQTRTATVAPDGSVQLVGIASVPAQGLTLDELQREINARYVELVGRGVEVTAILRQRAPRFVWVVGEVNQPGQYSLNQPITVIQALALARGFINGGNVREIIVFRRDDQWQLMATRLDVRGVFVGTTPLPSDNIWLRDDDVVVVPKGPVKRLDEFIELVFTRGLYGIVPFSGVSYGFFRQTAI